MSARLLATITRSVLTLFLLSSAFYCPLSVQENPASTQQPTYVYFQRTDRHAKYSTSDIYDQIVSEFREYLVANRVAALTENNVLALSAELPLSTVQEMARDSGAAYLLYVVVDRPISKWLKVTVRCYDSLFLLPFAPLQRGDDAILPRGALLEPAISGDAQLSRADFAAVRPKPLDPRRGPASVTFYYQNLGEGNSVSVWCGNFKLGLLKRGRKFTVNLPPGKYWLRTWDSRRSPITELDVE